MRLSDYLSKPISAKFEQSEGFLDNKKLACGKQKKIAVGVITLSYFCKCCDSEITFSSREELFCIGINDHLISIDCVLKCPRCGATVPVWFLVESENEIYSAYPNVRILKRTEKLSENVLLSRAKYGDYSVLLDQAEQAYRNGLGAGAIIYLRKIFERITEQIAEAEGIETKKKNGQTKPFKQILEDVDARRSFIPKEFSKNGYKLFRELSNIVHSNHDDVELWGLKKYDALRRLVIGILDNIKINEELMAAIGVLGWSKEDKNE